jgi:hypothetical protein
VLLFYSFYSSSTAGALLLRRYSERARIESTLATRLYAVYKLRMWRYGGIRRWLLVGGALRTPSPVVSQIPPDTAPASLPRHMVAASSGCSTAGRQQVHTYRSVLPQTQPGAQRPSPPPDGARLQARELEASQDLSLSLQRVLRIW